MTDNKTPMQQMIEHLQSELNHLESIKLTPKGEHGRLVTKIILSHAQSLLPTEKEFAGKVFDAGVDYGRQASHHANKQQFLNRYYKP